MIPEFPRDILSGQLREEQERALINRDQEGVKDDDHWGWAFASLVIFAAFIVVLTWGGR
ncbi:MAG: hypothetical protein ABFD60_04335 [Bryobacteraceae bacterium]